MFTFNPNEVPKSSQDFITALLCVLADPKAAQDHLDKINAATEEMAKEREALVAVGRANREANDADVVALTAQHDELTKREVALARIDATLAAATERENGANQAIAALTQAKADHAQREKELTAREVALAAREDRVGKMEADLTQRKQEVDAAEKDILQRHAALKAIVG